MKVGIIGLGMVGSPLKRYFEELHGKKRGKDLFLFDSDPAKHFDDDISRAEVIFLCVPTPRTPRGHANISAVGSAFLYIRSPRIVVIKSTVPPGTTESFQKKYPQHSVLFNPEFLTERQAWIDFLKPDRQIVGFTKKSETVAHAVLSLLPQAPFMSPWGIGTYRSIKITATEAEIIKYAGNVHFARKINFANLLALLSRRLGADYENIRAGLAADFRIGDSHLDVTHGGYCGFGGFCLPKDLDAFIAHLASQGLHECVALLEEDRAFNKKLLARQGLTLEDVSVHDHEWIQKKLKSKIKKSK